MRDLIRIALVIAVCAAALGSLAVAEELRLELTGHYRLVIDSQPDEGARLYLAQGQPKMVVISDQLSAPYLVTAGQRTVRPLSAKSWREDPQDAEALLVEMGSLDGDPHSLKPTGKALLFGVEGHRLKIEPPEVRVGDHTAKDLMEFSPEFRRLAKAYQPQKGNVALLRSRAEPVELQVFLGTWCPHCEKLVPRLAKTLAEVGNGQISANYRLVPRKMQDDPIARQYEIQGVPTILIIEQGQIKARLEGKQLEDPEASLARVLFGS